MISASAATSHGYFQDESESSLVSLNPLPATPVKCKSSQKTLGPLPRIANMHSYRPKTVPLRRL